jgi:hypothetical protein
MAIDAIGGIKISKAWLRERSIGSAKNEVIGVLMRTALCTFRLG